MRPKSCFIFFLTFFLLLGCNSKPDTAPVSTALQGAGTSAAPPSTGPYPMESEVAAPYPGNNQELVPPQAPDGSQPLPTPDINISPVIITKVALSQDGLETIFVTNISKEPQDITAFVLLVPETDERFYFPETNLDAGVSVKIYNGAEAQSQSDGLAWLDHVALQITGDSIVLLNKAGRMIWNYTIR